MTGVQTCALPISLFAAKSSTIRPPRRRDWFEPRPNGDCSRPLRCAGRREKCTSRKRREEVGVRVPNGHGRTVSGGLDYLRPPKNLISIPPFPRFANPDFVRLSLFARRCTSRSTIYVSREPACGSDLGFTVSGDRMTNSQPASISSLSYRPIATPV